MLAKDCLAEFKVECDLRRLSSRTTKGYYNNTALFLTYLEKHLEITEVEEIRTSHIKKYLQYLLAKKLSPSYIFPVTERAVQKQLHIVCDYLGYEGISTHSFRKWYATEIYKNSGYDIALVQRLLQHSSAATTQRYIGIEPQRIEAAIQNHLQLL